jgi:DNA modification methylase
MSETALPLDKVLTGDCVEVLYSLAAKSVDLVFADPPYNLQLRQDLWRPNMTKVDPVDDAWDQFQNFAEYDQFTRDWLSACRRALKDTGTLWVIGSYHNIHRIGAILLDMGYWILNEVTWIKTNPMPNFRGARFTNAHETLLWVQKKRGARYTFNHHAAKALNDDLQMRSDWYLPLCSGRERLKLNGAKAHSTQKPEALLYRVLLSSSKPGDVVLDPFFGTGTTGAVAKKLHRHYIGIEREKRYVKLARTRIAGVQPEIFSEELYQFEGKRQQRRIPFGALLENGLLKPGQRLYFGRKGKVEAVVLANGHLRVAANGNGHSEAVTGSIHQVGRALQNAPCNGWEHWYYEDAATGERAPIDALRETLRLESANDS